MWGLTIGIVMMAATVAIHAIGSAGWLEFMRVRVVEGGRSNESRRLVFGLVSTATALLVLHVLEALLWALVYIGLPGRAGFESYPQAVYFSMVTLTTLGYGDLTLAPKWQLLAGMQAMVGIVVFGLTTAILFAVVQRWWKVTHPRAAPKD